MIDPATIAKWRVRLAIGGTLDEHASLDLLADCGISVIPRCLAETRREAVAAAASLGFPVVLKTAAPGIARKSEIGGVKLGLKREEEVAAAYDDLAARLGPRVLVAPMAGAGVEMILGMTSDAQFGPTLLIGAGGIHAEVLRDVVLARPPFDAAWALKLIDRLKLRRLLDGVRGQPAGDVAALAEAASRLSGLAVALGDLIKEIDANPIIVGPEGCVAVDALVVAGAGGEFSNHDSRPALRHPL
jgi:acetate---CoA ligase (ADP-forming)